MKVGFSIVAAAGLLGASIALLLSFAALRFQSGVVVDATNAVGRLTSVEGAMAVAGVIFLITSILLVVVAYASRNRGAEVPQPRGI